MLSNYKPTEEEVEGTDGCAPICAMVTAIAAMLFLYFIFK